MLLANFNGKEHLRHRAVSLRQHGFLVGNAIAIPYVLLIVAFCAKIKQPRMTSKGHYACNLFQNICVTYSYSFALNLLLGNINGAHSCRLQCTVHRRMEIAQIWDYHRQRNFFTCLFRHPSAVNALNKRQNTRESTKLHIKIHKS